MALTPRGPYAPSAPRAAAKPDQPADVEERLSSVASKAYIAPKFYPIKGTIRENVQLFQKKYGSKWKTHQCKYRNEHTLCPPT